MKIRFLSLLCSIAVASVALLTPIHSDSIRPENGKVKLLRVPNGGLQPQAVMDENAVLHLIYLAGEPRGGDIFYLRRELGKDFSPRCQSKSKPGMAALTAQSLGPRLAS